MNEHHATDELFAGSIPRLYDELLVPLIFAPYADDLARRVAAIGPGRILELAAGTGVVTRRLSALLPASTSIVATDLNPPMLERAAEVGTVRPVEWRQADALALPFDDAAFDVVACQFGVMFFVPKARAFAEARRVLRPGGTLLFNVWDCLEHNEFTDVVTTALAALFPADPPRFMARTPHGYHDRATIASDLAAGGFTTTPRFDVVAARSTAVSPRIPAIALCQGTPLRSEIEARGTPSRLAEATDAAAAAIAHRFGSGAVDGAIRALLVSVER